MSDTPITAEKLKEIENLLETMHPFVFTKDLGGIEVAAEIFFHNPVAVDAQTLSFEPSVWVKKCSPVVETETDMYIGEEWIPEARDRIQQALREKLDLQVELEEREGFTDWPVDDGEEDDDARQRRGE